MASQLLKHFEWMFLHFWRVLDLYGHQVGDVPTEARRTRTRTLCCALRGGGCEWRRGRTATSFSCGSTASCMVTSLFLVLLVIESTDVVFAIDSVPAIFGITQDPFIVFTSNMFAIMGLRALYFLLAGVMNLFRYLSYGLSAILIFIGVKMMVHHWLASRAVAVAAGDCVVVGGCRSWRRSSRHRREKTAE